MTYFTMSIIVNCTTMNGCDVMSKPGVKCTKMFYFRVRVVLFVCVYTGRYFQQQHTYCPVE